jgi:acetyl-CoA acetyltransferase
VDELARLIEAVRRQARVVLARAHDAVEEGAPIARVIDYYVARAFDLAADAEAHAILVSAGDPAGLPAIETCLKDLEALLDELEEEFPS